MQPNTSEPVSSIKKQLHTVTPFSKLLAIIVFITLPFVGFWLGRQYPASPAPSPAVVNDEESAPTEAESDTATESETEPTANETTTPPPTTLSQPQTNTPAPAPTPTGPSEMTVVISDITLDSISVDNIAIYEGEAAVQRMIADGLCTAAEPQKCTLTDGRYYRNTDPTIRTYPLLDGVEVQTWTGGDYPLSQLVNRAQTQAPFTITTVNGVVVKIQEVYR